MSFLFIDDQSFSSASGRYRLEARSPMNGSVEDPSPDGSRRFDWLYQFFDEEARPRLVWERWATRLEMEPSQVWITERGSIVVDSTGPLHSDLITLHRSGKQALRIRMLPQQDSFEGLAFRSEHIRVSLADTIWRYGALESIFRFQDRDYFSLDFLWGESIILDLENYSWLKKGGVEDLSLALESARAEECLRRAQSKDHIDVLSALAALSRNPVSSMLPYLEQLEKTEETSDLPCGSSFKHEGYQYTQSQHGSLLRLALRRCGKLPDGKPCFRFQSESPVTVPKTEPDRDRIWEDSFKGTTWRKALSRFGSPDAISWHAEKRGKHFATAEIWDYYLGTGEEIFIARISWEPGANGESVSKFEILPLNSDCIGEYLAHLWRYYA